ncbi:phosphodiesterase [Marinibaculum pumilum]|uniref:Phosphodiesterase n=1 Tax=Marinibaculum pumilum TaxID=1766165 RepID=A0ABV7KVK4_9PROT
MITVAQISDTHIRRPGLKAYGRVDTAAHLAAAVSHLNSLRPAPDIVLATGDLVDFGEAAEFAHFQRIVAPLAAPLWPIPGNHDGPAFWQAFPDAAARRRAEGEGYLVETGPLRVVLFDSTVPGAPFGDALDPDGGSRRLDWLDTVLAAAPERPVLLALHHPPFATGIAHMDRQNLRQPERLAAVLEHHPQVLAVTCGHVHRSVATQFAGRPALICPSPAHAVALDLDPDGAPGFAMEPPGLLMHAWRDTGGRFGSLVSHVVPVGSFPGPFPFYAADGSLLG